MIRWWLKPGRLVYDAMKATVRHASTDVSGRKCPKCHSGPGEEDDFARFIEPRT